MHFYFAHIMVYIDLIYIIMCLYTFITINQPLGALDVEQPVMRD